MGKYGKMLDAYLASAWKGHPRWATIRKPLPSEALPPKVSEVIAWWVKGQSYRWIALKVGVDKMTARRWAHKHPHEVQRVLDELGWYGAIDAYELRRKADALRALGIAV